METSAPFCLTTLSIFSPSLPHLTLLGYKNSDCQNWAVWRCRLSEFPFTLTSPQQLQPRGVQDINHCSYARDPPVHLQPSVGTVVPCPDFSKFGVASLCLPASFLVGP